MVLPVVALLLLAGILVWQIRAASNTVGMIEESDERVALATLIERRVVDEETGLRGYQTTSDPRFLQPYLDSEVPLQEDVAKLRAIASPDQLKDLNAFVVEHDSWRTGFAETLIAIMSAGGETDEVDLNLTGKKGMDAMRTHLQSIVHSSENRREDRIVQWHGQLNDVLLMLVLLATAVGLAIGLFTRDRMHAVSAAFRRSLDLQHRRAEELFQSEQHLRTTLASIGDGVIACDANGHVQTMNVVAQELTGWLEADARNRPLEDIFKIVNEITREPVENPVARVKRLDRIVNLANHTVLVRRDGSEISIDDSGAPIRNEAGMLTGVVMVFRDTSMERKTRAALLANEKLAVAGRLAATIAHEIHNPLDSVSNLLYLLRSGSSAEESAQFLAMAQSELTRVTQISRAMLSLYRESKAPVPIALKDMLEDLLLLMERRFDDLGVTVTSDLSAAMTVDGFPAELRQVFTNLITNAAEAAGPGGRVTVRIRPRPGGFDEFGHKLEPGAIVDICDTGPGILPGIREHLFEPFFTTKGEHGTGLGLWVSQGIIRKHAGSIHLRSEPGGTVASVFLASKPIINPGGD
jgi:PAS domain S-box-containing protein